LHASADNRAMADDPPSSAHDALFRKIFGTPAHMAEELRAVLPSAIAELLDLSSLLPLPMRFADAHLQGAESDLLFSARVAGRKALVYVLIEHQSAPDRFMPLRLLRYIGRILDRYRCDHPRARRLPAVIPIVLCHDLRPWPYPADLGALYDLTDEARAELRPYLADFRFLLDDLARVTVPQLGARTPSPVVTLTLFALKRARHRVDLLLEVEQMAEHFAVAATAPVPDEQLAALLEYIVVVGRIPPDLLLTFLRTRAGDRLEAIMKTTAEQLIEQGEARGEARGKVLGQAIGLVEGQARTLRKLMQRKFGPLPAAVEAAISTASLEQLDRWVDRVLSAETAEDTIRE
jgi:predicted transposase YdaD